MFYMNIVINLMSLCLKCRASEVASPHGSSFFYRFHVLPYGRRRCFAGKLTIIHLNQSVIEQIKSQRQTHFCLSFSLLCMAIIWRQYFTKFLKSTKLPLNSGRCQGGVHFVNMASPNFRFVNFASIVGSIVSTQYHRFDEINEIAWSAAII